MRQQSTEKMMKKICFIAIVVAGVVLSSCSSYRVSSTPKLLEPRVAPVHATLEVRQSKFTYIYQQTFPKNAMVNEEQLRDNAVYEALAQAKADVLIAPTFKTEVEVDGRKYYTITVTGYPADYTGFVQEKAVMRPETLEVKELKKDAAYLLLDKDQNGNLVNFEVVGTGEGAIIVAPKAKPAEERKVVVEEKRTTISTEQPAKRKGFGKRKSNK